MSTDWKVQHVVARPYITSFIAMCFFQLFLTDGLRQVIRICTFSSLLWGHGEWSASQVASWLPSRLLVTIERLGYPVSDIEIGLAYHLLCRSRSRCWNIVSKVGLCRRDKYLTMALGRGVVLTRPLPNKTPSVGMKQLKLKLKLLDNTYG